MKKLLSYFILWFVLSIQASAAMVSPIGGGYEGQSQYIVKLESMPYVYRLNIYDDNHVLLDSTIQFTKGKNLDAFVLEDEGGNFEVVVEMTVEDKMDVQDVFRFDGSVIEKISG